MKLSPFWEAASCAATQELPSILWDSKLHYCVNKSPSLASILRQIRSWGRLSKWSVQVRAPLWGGEELLAPRPTAQQENRLLSAVRDCFSIYFYSYPPYLEAVSSIRNLRTRYEVSTKDPLNMVHKQCKNKYIQYVLAYKCTDHL
jgi:hypothetical protein